MSKTKKSAAEIEQDKIAAEVTNDVQMLYALSVIPNVLFTTMLVLLIPTAWFHVAFGYTDSNAIALAVWVLGIGAALFAGRLVPQVPIETILIALGGKAQEGNASAERLAYLAPKQSSDQD